MFEAQFQSLWVWSVSSAWSIYFETQLQLLVLHYIGKLPVHLDFPSMSKFQIWRRISRWTPKTRVLAVSACHSISKIIFNVQDYSIKNQPALLNSDFQNFCTYQSLYMSSKKKWKTNQFSLRGTMTKTDKSTGQAVNKLPRVSDTALLTVEGLGGVGDGIGQTEGCWGEVLNSHIQHLSDFTVDSVKKNMLRSSAKWCKMNKSPHAMPCQARLSSFWERAGSAEDDLISKIIRCVPPCTTELVMMLMSIHVTKQNICSCRLRFWRVFHKTQSHISPPWTTY